MLAVSERERERKNNEPTEETCVGRSLPIDLFS